MSKKGPITYYSLQSFAAAVRREQQGHGKMKRMTRENADQYMDRAIHDFELALGEVRVIERREKGEVTHRAISNKDAIERAKTAYVRASTAVETVRIEEAGAEDAGTRRRAGLRNAIARLDLARARLNELVEWAKGV